jgi:HEAT repeat protein
MAFLGLFGGKSGPGAVKKHGARVANKRAQAPDRWDSIQALGAMGTEEAAEALLQRFTFRVDPSITDQEEKDAAFEGIVRAGSAAVPPVRRFLQRSDSIAWPLKCLERLLDEEEVTGELLAVLETMDIEYERDPDKKIQILAALEERQDERVVPAVQRFLEDANETARFHAVQTLLAQGDDSVQEPLLATALKEESLRVRSAILDGFIARNWSAGDRRDELQAKLPPGYAVDGQGKPRKG